jgi:hypothetical protein
MWRAEKVGAVSSSSGTVALPVYPESRGVYPESRRASTFLPLGSHSERLHGLSRATNCTKLNLQTREVERLATRTKQTVVTCSNRQVFHFCPHENSTLLSSLGAQHAAPGTRSWQSLDHSAKFAFRLSQFLTETDSQSKIAVTHSKQTTGAFLTETRIEHVASPCPEHLLRETVKITASRPRTRRSQETT